jgi:hypothetical protein
MRGDELNRLGRKFTGHVMLNNREVYVTEENHDCACQDVRTWIVTGSCPGARGPLRHSRHCEFSELQVQDDRKVTQPILKYLLRVAIQYNSIELINTQYRCDYTRSHAGHVML